MQSQFLFLTVTLFVRGYTSVTLFSPCKPMQLCDGATICRFGICIPPTASVSLSSSNGNGINANSFSRPILNTAMNTLEPFIMNHNILKPNPSITTYLQGTVPLVPECQPRCLEGANCIRGVCICLSPSVTYSNIGGCSSVFKVATAPRRMTPQALPGAACIPGVECTGGSICSFGTCICPPELIHQGTVCVIRTFAFQHK